MPKIGFALSLYDKFDDLETVIDIIRSWKHDYVISVCCNHPQGKKRLQDVDYDLFCQPRHIAQFGNYMTSEKWDHAAQYAHHMRCTESVRSSCQNLEQTDVDIGVHLHSDAWFLNEHKLRVLIQNMIMKKKRVATRGNGLEYVWHPFRQCNAFGNVDDHGIIWDVPWCEQRHVWDFKPEALMYHKRSVHAQLGLVFGVKVGLDNWWYYPYHPVDYNNCFTRGLSPYNFDTMHRLLHVNVDTLPFDWGRSLQANMLQEHGYDLLKEFRDKNVVSKINDFDRLYRWRLRLCGFSRKQVSAKPPLLKKQDMSNITLRGILRNYRHQIIDWMLDKLFPMPDDAACWYRRQGMIDELVPGDNWTSSIYDDVIEEVQT